MGRSDHILIISIKGIVIGISAGIAAEFLIGSPDDFFTAFRTTSIHYLKLINNFRFFFPLDKMKPKYYFEFKKNTPPFKWE
jgi:hypothetical protein